jgi:hypothetical protein
MQGCLQSTPPSAPPWIEEAAIRETTLQCIDDPSDREMIRHVGAVIHLMFLESTRRCGTTDDDPSVIRAELRALAADLSYVRGYCDMVRRSAADSSLDASDEALARFAGRMGKKVQAIVGAIEARLS